MSLSDAIELVMELTARLHAGLSAGQDGDWDVLLTDRAQAMVLFQDAHRAAGASELSACSEAIVALQSADRELQELAAEALADADAACRGQLGAAPTGASSYHDDPAFADAHRHAVNQHA